MEKIVIDAGCLNGYTKAQYDFLIAMKEKIKELWPDVQYKTECSGCKSITTYSNEYVNLSYSIDSSD